MGTASTSEGVPALAQEGLNLLPLETARGRTVSVFAPGGRELRPDVLGVRLKGPGDTISLVVKRAA